RKRDSNLWSHLQRGHRSAGAQLRSSLASSLEEGGFEPCMGLFLSRGLFWFCLEFFVRSGKAVLHPVACDQVCGARGRGQGTETRAELAACRLAALVFRSALTPEHAER